MRYKIALLCFDEMEVLDFAGPFEVFSVANELSDYTLLDITLLGYQRAQILCRNGLSINSHQRWQADDAGYDLLIVPGGNGSRALLKDAGLLGWIKTLHADPQRKILSVCSGALILAAAGVLAGKQATTHHEVMAELETMAVDFEVVHGRYVDNGDVITSAGISAGIDASLHFVAQHFGADLAHKVRTYMEYSV